MPFAIGDLVGSIALLAGGMVDLVGSAMAAMYAGGMPDGMGPDGLVLGTGAAAAAASASGGSDGTTGGSNVGRNERTKVPNSTVARERWREAQHARREYEKTTRGQVDRAVLKASQQLQNWAESIVGKEVKGTTAAASKA